MHRLRRFGRLGSAYRRSSYSGVVKGWNSVEVEGYAKLIALGHISLIEVKCVAFCGKSDASNLKMSNTPWHHEVMALMESFGSNLRNSVSERLAMMPLPSMDILVITGILKESFSLVFLGKWNECFLTAAAIHMRMHLTVVRHDLR